MAPQGGLLDRPDWQNTESPDWEPKDSFTPASPAGWAPTLKHYLRRLPSLIRSRAPNTSGPAEKTKPRRTAYLDGLRGFAALIVYCHHHVLWAHRGPAEAQLELGFGYEDKFAFATFHWTRTFFTGGHFAVTTFFVISGYVLSAKPLSLIQSGDYVKLGDNLASALFRRWLRLYIPLVATTFIYMLTWHLFGFGKLWVSPAKPQSNLHDEIWWYYAEFKNFSFIFGGGDPWFAYNFHTWSIPVEMKGSIIIYTALQAFSRLTTKARLLAECGLIYYFLYIADGWYGAIFCAGLLLSDLDLLAIRGDLPRFLARLEPYNTFLYYHLFFFALYLGGVPSHSADIKELRDTRGWYLLSFLKPQAVFDYKWFYLFWAATFLVSSVPRIGWLRRFFETRFCQYLGRVSYCLYLVHGPVLWVVGDRLYAATGWVREEHKEHIPGWVNAFELPKTGPLGLEVSFLVPQLVLLPLTFWLAEMATRAFDEPAVRFAQWLYRKGLPAGEK